VHGDGSADLAIGSAAGRDLWVLYGRGDIGAGGVVDVGSLAQEAGITVLVHATADGLSQLFLANALAAAGDVNGDGFDDLACAIQRPSRPGEAFVLLGPPYPADCDRNGILDECQRNDDDGDGVPDRCELVRFRSGDASADGSFDITDPVLVLSCLFVLETCPMPCYAAGDVDGNGIANITDAIYSLNYLFLGGPPPVHPFDACATRGFADRARCEAYPPCG
jgi:hypothetical protein